MGLVNAGAKRGDKAEVWPVGSRPIVASSGCEYGQNVVGVIAVQHKDCADLATKCGAGAQTVNNSLTTSVSPSMEAS